MDIGAADSSLLDLDKYFIWSDFRYRQLHQYQPEIKDEAHRLVAGV